MNELEMNLEDLEHKWRRNRNESCCCCDMNFEENKELPLRMWRDPLNANRCMELALCWKCAECRTQKDFKECDHGV